MRAPCAPSAWPPSTPPRTSASPGSCPASPTSSGPPTASDPREAGRGGPSSRGVYGQEPEKTKESVVPAARFVEQLNAQIGNEFAAHHQYLACAVYYDAL